MSGPSWPGEAAAPGLRLDARQRAMLDEMGVKVWAPVARAVPPAEPAELPARAEPPAMPAADAPLAASPAVTPAPSPVVPPAVSEDRPTAARPSPPAPPRAAASGPAPSARPPGGAPGVSFDAPLRLYATLDEDGIAPPPQGGWLVVADLPPGADGRHGEPFAGDAGRLLDNMLRALRLHDGPLPVHLVRAHRDATIATARQGAAQSAAFAALARDLAPRIVLAMGPLAAQGLLRSAEPLGRLRGRAVPLPADGDDALDGVPVVATYHPAYLLRNPADKARAWADLCLAADRVAPPPA